MSKDNMPSGIYGVSHVSFLVPDLQSTVEYYKGAFGFVVLNDFVSAHTGRRYITMGKGSFSLELTESQDKDNAGEELPQGKLQHIAFQTRGIEKVVSELREKGVEIIRDITKGTGTIQFAYLRDPNGFIIELFDEGY